MAKNLFEESNTRTAETIDGILDPMAGAEMEQPKTPKRPGQPRKKEIIRDNSVQAGLTADYTRATFILRVETLNGLKDYAYTERKPIKEAVDEIISNFLNEYTKNHELLNHKER